MKTMFALLAALTLAATLGCSRQEEGKAAQTPKVEQGGKAEQAGKKLDQAIEKAQVATAEKLKEVGEALQRAGEELKKKE